MIVRAVESSFARAPQDVLDSGWSRGCQIDLTAQKEYEVYALAVFKHNLPGAARLIFFQIIDDTGYIALLPSFLFEVIKRDMPADWQCNLLPDGTLVIGPSFVSESEEAYQQMAELDPDVTRRFYERKKRIDRLGDSD